MHERDGGLSRSPARGLVDEARALDAEMIERSRDVLHAKGDVVEARPACGEKRPNRRVVAERAEELHERAAGGEQDLLDALILDALAMNGTNPEQARVAIHGGVEVSDGDADVVDIRRQRPIAQRAAPRRGRRGEGCILATSSIASETW